MRFKSLSIKKIDFKNLDIRTLDVVFIGGALSLMVLSCAYFKSIKPNLTEIEYYNEYIAVLQDQADKLPLANQRVRIAEKTVNQITENWQNVVLEKTPPADVKKGGINLDVNRWQLTVDAKKFRDSIQAALNKQLKAGGVEVIEGPTIPFPPSTAGRLIDDYFNYPAIPFPVAIFDLGTVTVKGTLNKILAHIEAWNHFAHYIAVTDGLKIRGTSPDLIATYNLTILVYIRGHDVAPPIPEDSDLTKPYSATQVQRRSRS